MIIEHDLDVIRNADYIIDMGPGGGEDGGRVVAVGTPEQISSKCRQHYGKISVIKDSFLYRQHMLPVSIIIPRVSICFASSIF